MKTEQLEALVLDDLRQVNDIIRQHLNSDLLLVRQATECVLGANRLPLRAVVSLLTGRAFGFDVARHRALAAAIELINSALTLHHAVVDVTGDVEAHAPTLFGNAGGTLLGDLFYTGAFKLILKLDDLRVMRVLSDAISVTAEGEVMHHMACRDAGLTTARYLDVVRTRTAKLFEAAARSAAIIAGVTPDVENALMMYGMHLGTASQLLAELGDFAPETAPDATQPLSLSLPVVHTMRSGTAATAQRIHEALLHDRRDDGPLIMEAVMTSGALEYTRACAGDELQRARAAIAGLADCEFTEALRRLPL